MPTRVQLFCQTVGRLAYAEEEEEDASSGKFVTADLVPVTDKS